MKKTIIATIVICLCSVSAFAEPVTITNARSFLVNRSLNSIGFPWGVSILVVADIDPYDQTGVWGRDENGDLGEFVSFAPQIFIGQFGRTFPYDESLRDRWELWACYKEDCENEIYSGPVFTNDLEGVGFLPFVTDVGYHYAFQDNMPTITWKVPESAFGDRIRITVIHYYQNPDDPLDVTVIKPAVYESPPIPLQITQHRIPDVEVFSDQTADSFYAIRVKLEATDDDTITGNLISRSESFFNYRHRAQVSGGTIYLPMVGVDSDSTDEFGAPFKFDCEVVDGESILIDPFVAIGYDYKIGEGDPAFASVTLPDVGDNLFDIYLYDGSDFYLAKKDLPAGQSYDFGSGGVDRFRVVGIAKAIEIDPNDTTIFVTKLTFTGPGRFTGTMTPIVASTPGPDNNQVCSTLGDDPKPSLLDQDIFKFQGADGEDVIIRLEDAEGYISGDRATLILMDKIRRVWLLKTDRGPLPKTITATLPATGEYRIIISEQSRFAKGERFRGDYCLTLESSENAWQTLETTYWVE